jgi:hypothetical protein
MNRILRDAPNPERQDASELLGWLVCSKRRTFWREYQGAKSVDLEKQEVNWQKRHLRVDSKDLCGSLVEIGCEESIELVHNTAKT